MDRSKNIFRPGVISGKLSRSRDNLRHFLLSPKIEGGQISNLIRPIDSRFKCDNFL